LFLAKQVEDRMQSVRVSMMTAPMPNWRLGEPISDPQCARLLGRERAQARSPAVPAAQVLGMGDAELGFPAIGA
jgi:hypothetical protein